MPPQRSTLAQVALLAFLCLVAGYRQWVHQPWGLDGYFLYIPGVMFGPVCGLQVLLALRKRTRLQAVLLMASLGVWIGPLMGFTWHFGGRLSPSWVLVSLNADSWETDLPRCSQKLREQDPDIIVLQEVWATKHVELLLKGLPNHYVPVEPTPADFDEGNLVLLKRGGPFQCLRRVVTYAAAGFVLESTSGQFLVISNHSPRGRTPRPAGLYETVRRQTDQAGAVIQLARSEGLPTIVAGDFNSLPCGPSQKLLGDSFHAAWPDAGRGFAWSYPAGHPILAIDHVWASKEYRFESIRRVDFGSDHLGLVCEISRAETEPEK